MSANSWIQKLPAERIAIRTHHAEKPTFDIDANKNHRHSHNSTNFCCVSATNIHICFASLITYRTTGRRCFQICSKTSVLQTAQIAECFIHKQKCRKRYWIMFKMQLRINHANQPSTVVAIIYVQIIEHVHLKNQCIQTKWSNIPCLQTTMV